MKKNIDIVRDYLNGERPYIKVGYKGDMDKYIIRKVGERWTDSSGKEWEQKDYGPSAVTRVSDIIREEMEQKCECCGGEIRWGSRQDRKMFYRTKKCLDCTVEEETQLRLKGKFKLYETKKIIENELSYLKDIRVKLKESKEYLETHKEIQFPNGNGTMETWSNEARDELLEGVKKDFVTCLKKIKASEKELKKVNDEIGKVLTPV
jgi:hypothetical protein